MSCELRYAWSSVLAVFELWSSRYEVEAQLKLRLKLVSSKLSLFQAHEKNSLKRMHFSLNSTIIFNLGLTHLLFSERIHIKTGKKLPIFFKLTLFKWFSLKNFMFISLIIQMRSSEAQLKDQEFWAALIEARAWSCSH